MENFQHQFKCSVHNIPAEYYCIHEDCLKQNKFSLCQCCYTIHSSDHKPYHHSVIHSSYLTNTIQKTFEIQENKTKEVLGYVEKLYHSMEVEIMNNLQESYKRSKSQIEKAHYLQDLTELSAASTLNASKCNSKTFAIKDYLMSYATMYKKYIEIWMKIDQIELDYKIDLGSTIEVLLSGSQQLLKDFQKEISQIENIITKNNRKYSKYEFFIKNISKPFCNHRYDILEEIEVIETPHNKSIEQIIYFNNNSNGSNNLCTVSRDGQLIVWNDNINIFDTKLKEHELNHCIYLTSGQIASIVGDNMIKIQNIQNGLTEKDLTGHTDLITCLIELPGSILMSSSIDRSIRFWDLNSREETNSSFMVIENDAQKECQDLTLLNEDVFAVTSANKIHLYDFAHMLEPMKTLTGHDGIIQKLLFSKLNKELLVSLDADGMIKVWDWQQSNCLQTFDAQSSKINSLLFYKSDVLLTGSLDGYINLWDILKGKILRSIKLSDFTDENDENDEINHVTINKEGNLIVCQGNKLRIWGEDIIVVE